MRMRFEFEEDDKYFDVTISKEGNTVGIRNFSCNTGELEYTLQNMKLIKSTESNSYQTENYSFNLKVLKNLMSI